MIEIRIVEDGERWTARLTQTPDDPRIPSYRHTRVLQREFDTNIEAWQWAQRITNRWKEAT